MKVYVNGREREVAYGVATYTEVVELAGLKGKPTVTYHHREAGGGTLSAGETVGVREGMIFNVASTTNA